MMYYKGYLPHDLETITQEELDAVLLSVVEDEKDWENFKRLFDYEVTPYNLKVRYMRSQLIFAGPLQYDTGEFDEEGLPVYSRYESMSDRYDEQNKQVQEFQVHLSSSIETNNLGYYPGVKRTFFSMTMYRYRVMEVASGDSMYATFSVLFVFFYIWFHLRSLFLSFSAMVLIIISFPVTQFIYRAVFQVTMYTFLNQLIIFIVLGIAADNVFVFCDAWRQSEHIPIMSKDLHRRMAYSFKRAFNAILVTASTTSIAFAANILSPLTPFRAFGL